MAEVLSQPAEKELGNKLPYPLLISRQGSALAEINWKLEGKELLDAVHRGQSLRGLAG